MFRPLALFIGLRYTWTKRKNNFISFISGISMIGMILGVMILIIVMSVMKGFKDQLQTRILGMVPHATVSGVKGYLTDWKPIMQQLKKQPGVVAAAPFSQNQGLLSGNGVVHGILLNGIDPEYEKTVSALNEYMHSGSLESLKPHTFNIIIGNSLAQKLGVSIGDKITVMLPEASINPMGIFPGLKRFNIAGTFSVGSGMDDNMAYINIQDAMTFLRLPPDSVQSIRLKADDLFKAPQIVYNAVRHLKGQYYFNNWTQNYGQLFSAVHMEKAMVALLLSFLIAIAAFNIISTLIMVVTDKRGDIAILRTLGASPQTIMSVFMVQGVLIGVTGTVFGAILGVVGALNIAAIAAWIQRMLGVQFLDPDIYFIDFLPSKLQWEDVVVICCFSLLFSFLATLYPAWKASKTQPAEALRYE